MKDSDLIGKSVVSMGDGATVGTIRDLVFRGMNLDALIVRGDRGDGLLPFACVGTNGPDAATIDSYEMVDWSKGPILGPDTMDMHHLRKLSVVNGEGENIGHLHDLTMDSAGNVQQISVRTEGVFGFGAHETVVPSSQVRAIGSELITVEADRG